VDLLVFLAFSKSLWCVPELMFSHAVRHWCTIHMRMQFATRKNAVEIRHAGFFLCLACTHIDFSTHFLPPASATTTGKGLCNFPREYLFMKKPGETVEDNTTNLEICHKYCGSCPTFKANNLKDYPPYGLFCARGKSSSTKMVKSATCFCPACELFTQNHLVIGHFCTR